MNDVPKVAALETRSRVIHWAFWYDVMLKVRSLGREQRVREKFLDLAKVGPGQSILDAGCGTGTMAIAARRRVDAAGNVCAVDASPEMIARARQKAARQGADIHFETALLEALPFPDAKFDVVTTSFVLHHFPADLLQRCLAELRRVLKPNGRLVAFDFAGGGHHGLFVRHNHPHSTFSLSAITPALNEAGLVVRERGAAGFAGAVFITATPGAPAEQRALPESVSVEGQRPSLSHVALGAAIGTFLVSMVAVLLFTAGKKWLWFSAGTTTVILAVHVVTYHTALALGGTSFLAYAARWIHRQPPPNDAGVG